MASRYVRMHILVGGFVLTVLILLAFWATAGGALIKPSIEVVTYLEQNAGFSSSTPVSFLGMSIGRVSEVGFADPASARPAKPIRMTLRVEKAHAQRIRTDFVATYEADPLGGLLSNKIILKPPDAPEEEAAGERPSARPIADGDELVFERQPPITEFLKELGLQVTAKTLPVIDEVARAADELVAGAAGLIDALSNPIGDFQSIIRGVRYLMENVNDPAGPVLGTLDTVGRLASSLERGEGLAGRIMTDPALADEIKASIEEVHRILAHANAVAAEVREQTPALLQASSATLENIARLTEQAQPLPSQLSAVLDQTRAAVQPFAAQAARITGLLVQLRRDAELAEEIMSALTRHWLLKAYVTPQAGEHPLLLAPSLDAGQPAQGEGE
ncbi:MAG: MlaD family protein [Planctomycetota bacterium]